MRLKNLLRNLNSCKLHTFLVNPWHNCSHYILQFFDDTNTNNLDKMQWIENLEWENCKLHISISGRKFNSSWSFFLEAVDIIYSLISVFNQMLLFFLSHFLNGNENNDQCLWLLVTDYVRCISGNYQLSS